MSLKTVDKVSNFKNLFVATDPAENKLDRTLLKNIFSHIYLQ